MELRRRFKAGSSAKVDSRQVSQRSRISSQNCRERMSPVLLLHSHSLPASSVSSFRRKIWGGEIGDDSMFWAAELWHWYPRYLYVSSYIGKHASTWNNSCTLSNVPFLSNWWNDWYTYVVWQVQWVSLLILTEHDRRESVMYRRFEWDVTVIHELRHRLYNSFLARKVADWKPRPRKVRASTVRSACQNLWVFITDTIMRFLLLQSMSARVCPFMPLPILSFHIITWNKRKKDFKEKI
jgi:hypothetical protein